MYIYTYKEREMLNTAFKLLQQSYETKEYYKDISKTSSSLEIF